MDHEMLLKLLDLYLDLYDAFLRSSRRWSLVERGLAAVSMDMEMDDPEVRKPPAISLLQAISLLRPASLLPAAVPARSLSLQTQWREGPCASLIGCV